MSPAIPFKNIQILIKDAASGQLLANTTVGHYDPRTNILKIPMSSVAFPDNRSVLVLISTGDNLYEYSGQMRRAVVANEVSIALFAGHSKNKRQYKRSPINAHGLIEGIILNNQTVLLRKPIPITAMNISRGGLRIQAMTGSLEVGTAFLASLDVPSRQFRYEYRVVSVHNSDSETEEYGCQIFHSK